MVTSTLNPNNTDLLVGAIELAILDRLRAKFVDDKEILTLFVIDFPHLAHIHCIPPLHLDLVETTGLLTSKPKSASTEGSTPPYADHRLMKELAREYPKELGLTEVLSRYLFDKRWSSKLPKLMLSTQINEASDLEDGIRNGAMHEWQDAQTSASTIADGLENIAKEHAGNVKSFVEAAIEHAEITLPALYGTYSQTRRYLRFSDIKPAAVSEPQERPVMFADAVIEVQQYLDEVEAPGENQAAVRFDEIASKWKSAIEKIYPSDEANRLARRASDAKTLALLEYLNIRLAEDNKKCRLVFLTSHSALFDAAGLRFGCQSSRERSRRPSHGSNSNRSRSRYSAWLLENTKGVSAAPILDPRVFMTSRDFIEYAAPSTDQASKKENVQAITEWLPLFFNGREHDTALLARSYLHLQGFTKGVAPLLAVGEFGESQFSTLISSWDKYIRTISTAHGISKSISRESIRDLLVKVVQGQPGTVLEEIRLRMAKLLSEWLPAVGGATFSQLQVSQTKPISAPKKVPSRSVPPLLMPAFDKIQTSLISLLGDSTPMSRRHQADLAWLTEPNSGTLGIDKKWCDGGSFRVEYIQALGLAYGFAIEENWSAAYRLASIAQDTAKLAPKGNADSRDMRYLSGREAAFLCSFTIRRRFASIPIELAARPMGERFVRDMENALRREQPLFEANNWIEKLDAHRARIHGESLSWQVFRILSDRALESIRETRGSLSLFVVDTLILEKDLRITADTATKFCSSFSKAHSSNNGNDHAAYAFAMYYLARQTWLGLLQLQLFVQTPNDLIMEDRKRSLANTLEKLEQIEALRPEKCTWTGLEYDMVCAATKLANTKSFLPFPPNDENGSIALANGKSNVLAQKPIDFQGGLNRWRREELAKLLA